MKSSEREEKRRGRKSFLSLPTSAAVRIAYPMKQVRSEMCAWFTSSATKKNTNAPPNEEPKERKKKK